MDDLAAANTNNYRNEEKQIEKQSAELMEEMKKKYQAFKDTYFISLKRKVEDLVNLLSQDYADEWKKVTVDTTSFISKSYEENEAQLHTLLGKINEYIQRLNAVNFDVLVPPVKIEVEGEVFCAYTDGLVKSYNYTTAERKSIIDPKPIRDIVKGVFPYCKQAIACIETLVIIYDRKFNINGFNAFVQSSAAAWLSEVKAKLDSNYTSKFDALFRNEQAQAIPKSFFTQLEEDGKEACVDVLTGASTYKDMITIGNVKLLAEDKAKHLEYIKNSPVLNKYLNNGYLVAPLILDLKRCGNVFINLDEENYEDDTIDFINQLIIQFLLSFPANRINFCLIDIDTKMNFSQFKSLTKINNNILFNGIIRDDRQLENTIKDMEQTMYKIDDDILSYNNVEDIYEYNRRFEANPQSMHLFVLVNYPTGMRDDTAKRVMKIIQNGNKAGIFSIIINNKAAALSPSYKATEMAQFIENAEKASLVINKSGSIFKLNMSIKNYFEPQKDISISSLSDIVNILKDSAESNRQKVIPLSQMFKATDDMAASLKGIPSSAEVLDIPIGARGGEVQNILLKTTGDGSAHAVVIGGTGSGKSNLLHAIIMSACYKYSPEELNLYLIDFKGGVEFKFYEANKVKERQMPHIKLTGLTSDLEDGVAILNNLHKELRRREDEFRKNGVEDIVQYRNLGKKLPRLFVIIDEIQELFEQDDKLGQKAIDILRELFKKGRAFGINILWASQNIPKVPGLKDKVLSQIGNRISLRLNEPDDALDIKIDPKVVKNLNRPEKGLGVVNDIRYGNESIEFRVAYAETSENRQKYAKEIIDKWRVVTSNSHQEPLFIVGDDDDSSPIDGNTMYNVIPTNDYIVSKSFGGYVLQLGQDYVTGKPFDITLSSQNKMNLLLAGYDVEILRDMMGYSLLSVLMNQMTNADCIAEGTKVYYANGEMIRPDTSADLFNVLRNDFVGMLENISSVENMLENVKKVYKVYKQRSLDSNASSDIKVYTPYYIVIHSLQRYVDLFNENPKLVLTEDVKEETSNVEMQTSQSMNNAAQRFGFTKANAAKLAINSSSSTSSKPKMPSEIFFADAFKELLMRGGEFGIHFILSIDNPLGINIIKNELTESMYKVFVKGINGNVIAQMLGDYKVANSLSNPKVALVAWQDERAKMRVYRYDTAQDSTWYKALCANYNKLHGK